MKISHTAISAIRGDEYVKEKIASLMNVDVSTVYRWVNANKKNGPLTTFSVIAFIAQQYGLTTKQILDDEMELQESDVHVEKKEEVQTDVI